MPESWQQRIETIASNLLTLEINTAIKEEGISAQKMPEPPIALHTIVEIYTNYLLKVEKCAITEPLLRAAAARLVAAGTGEAERRVLETWPFSPDDKLASALTNGAETFEAMQWAAKTGLDRKGESAAHTEKLQRIRANSRQLREAAIVLEQQYSSPENGGPADLQTRQESMLTYRTRLEYLRDGASGYQEDLTNSRLFGGTIDQTAKALFRHPRPTLAIAPDLTVLIRKAWDLGLEQVRFQTIMQLDGDVLVRFAREIDAEQRTYLGEVHRQACLDGIAQWHLLFKVIGDLIGTVGQLIFGRRGA